MTELLTEKDFAGLNQTLSNIDLMYEESFTNEGYIATAFEYLGNQEGKKQEVFDEWVTYDPNSYVPYMVRGIFKLSTAYQVRGTKFVNETEEGKLDQFNRLCQLAIDDIQKGLDLNSESYIGNLKNLHLTFLSAGKDKGIELFEENYEKYKFSYRFWDQYFRYLSPRWYGHRDAFPMAKPILDNINLNLRVTNYSYIREGMERMKPLIDTNKKLQVHLGFEIYDKYDLYAKKFSNNVKILYLNKLFQVYRDPMHLGWMSYNYAQIGQHETAIEYSEEANSLYKTEKGILNIAIAYMGQKEYVKALEKVNEADEFCPSCNISQYKPWYVDKIVKDAFDRASVEEALKLFEIAINFLPNYTESHYWKGRKLIDANRIEEAKEVYNDLRKSHPNYTLAYSSLAWIYNKKENTPKKSIEILEGFLNKYENETKDKSILGDIYYEKARAHMLLGQETISIRIMGKACDLGYKRACDTMKER